MLMKLKLKILKLIYDTIIFNVNARKHADEDCVIYRKNEKNEDKEDKEEENDEDDVVVENEENYAVQEVKMLAISLNVQGKYDENIKTTPLTCRIDIDRMSKLIYMDAKEELGHKFVYYNKPVRTLMKPAKRGYTFVHWANKDNEYVEEDFVLKSTVDYRIYAKWNIIVSELKVDPNGGTWNENIGVQSFNMKYNYEKEIVNPTRVGYTFLNWDLTGEDSSLNDNLFKMGIEDAHLKALWKANTYKLVIDPNEGEYDGNSQPFETDIVYDSTVSISTPTRRGYTFNGWTVSNGQLNGDKFFMNYAGDVLLTANWLINDYEYLFYHKQQSIDGSSYNIVSADTFSGKANYQSIVTPKVNSYVDFKSPIEKQLIIDVDTVP